MMDRQRRTLLAGGTACAVSLLAGCATRAVWDLDPKYHYSEEVTSVLISSDEKTIVVFGKMYHYILAADPVIGTTLKSSFHNAVTAGFFDFRVSGNTVTGKFNLRLSRTASEEEIRAAIDAGYTKLISNPISACEYSGKITGTRYESRGIQPGETQKLNKSYTILIGVIHKSGDTMEKVLMTPLALTVDGVVLLGQITFVTLAILLGYA